MLIALIQRPGERKLNRQTILLDGVQVGYFRPGGRIQLIRHVDQETAAAISGEIRQITQSAVSSISIPSPTPPEFLPADEPSPILLP